MLQVAHRILVVHLRDAAFQRGQRGIAARRRLRGGRQRNARFIQREVIGHDGQVRVAGVAPALGVAAVVLRPVMRHGDLPGIALAHVLVLVDAAFDARVVLAIALQQQAVVAHLAERPSAARLASGWSMTSKCSAPAPGPGGHRPACRSATSRWPSLPVTVSAPWMNFALAENSAPISFHRPGLGKVRVQALQVLHLPQRFDALDILGQRVDGIRGLRDSRRSRAAPRPAGVYPGKERKACRCSWPWEFRDKGHRILDQRLRDRRASAGSRHARCGSHFAERT